MAFEFILASPEENKRSVRSGKRISLVRSAFLDKIKGG
jgi:hypothetical protein